MQNFLFDLPTKVYFGKGQIEHLPKAIKEYGKNVLLVYGGGSIKKIGLYDEIIRLLKEEQIQYTELAGVDPNPLIDTVRKGVEICRKENIAVILPVGGGSTIDCSKAIAASVSYEGDPWDLVLDSSKIKSVLPIITVLTLAATGSEMNAGAVISNPVSEDKRGFGAPGMKPKYSFLDPEYTYSVSSYQTAAGTADIMSHIFENYFQSEPGTFMQDRMAEALLKTCIKYGPIALKDPSNYEARANLLWAGTWAINGLLGEGKNNEWSVHPIEHELSAYYNITHGVGLAILTPQWMNQVLNEDTLEKFVEYGINVWEIDSKLLKREIAEQSILRTKDFFTSSLGIPATLAEIGINEEKFQIMAEKSGTDMAYAYVPLTKADIVSIYQKSL